VKRALAAGIGIAFGAVLSWSGMTSPDVIRGALLFEQSYLFLFFASAVLTAAAGTELLRRRRGTPVARERIERRHIAGAAIFGLGWAVTDACPGPVATQLGQGIGWAVFTMAGIVLGIRLFQRQGAAETEPARERPAGTPAPAPASAPR
jgi:uncharacterized membrane protein YedE/YeeE